jgi:hypothetical protein
VENNSEETWLLEAPPLYAMPTDDADDDDNNV